MIKNKKQLYTILCTFLSIGALVLAIWFLLSSAIHHEISGYMRPEQQISTVFNSNQLFLPYLYKNLFIHHGSFSHWTLPPVPFLFPDGLIFFLLAPLFHNIQTAILLSNAALAILYYALIVSIGTFVSGKQQKNLFRFSALLSLSLACGHLHDHEIMFPLWSSHFGSTIVVYLACLLLMLKIIQETVIKKKLIYAGLLSIMIFLTSLSDPYFFVLLLGSVTAGLLTLSLHKIITPKLAVSLFLLIFFIAGLAFLSNFYNWLHLNICSFIHLKANTLPLIHFSWPSALVLHKIFTLYYAHNPVIVFISLAFIFIGLKLFVFRTPLNSSAVFIIVCVAFSTLTTFFSSLFLDQDLLHPHFLSLRHFQSAILLPTFLCLPILLAQSEHITKYTNQYYVPLLALLIACLFLFQPHDSLKKMIHFYPSLTRCLDTYAQQGQLMNKNGIAQYWDAHVNDILSKENLNVVAINRYQKPYNWMSTKQDYINKKFHFILIREPTFPANTITQHWGVPDTILRCHHANNYQIFVYNTGFYIDGKHPLQ